MVKVNVRLYLCHRHHQFDQNILNGMDIHDSDHNVLILLICLDYHKILMLYHYHNAKRTRERARDGKPLTKNTFEN